MHKTKINNLNLIVENIQKATLTIFLYLFIKLRFMKRITIAGFLFTSFSFFAQQQIGNGNMESWDNVGQGTEEPTNWNSFKSAQGSFTSFASQQLQRSTSIRTGATGQYCARIWSKSTLGIVANGNLTVGRINMGSTTPSDPANYNISLTADANFSEALTTSSDSLVFWVKYTAANSSDSARVHAILHDTYDLRDPLDANSIPHIVARAERNYGKTNGSWARISVPFNYVVGSPALSPSFILITFTTNKTPGGGSNNDEVLIDDVELVYNSSVGISENKSESFYVNYNVTSGLEIFGKEMTVNLVDTKGVSIKNGNTEDLRGLILKSGLYFVQSPTKTIKVLVP
jgi:hypothetical protein